jgi:hypothetical protein
LIRQASAAELDRLADLLGASLRGNATALISIRDGAIGAAVGYEWVTATTVECHIWIGDRKCVTPRFMREIFGDPFSQAGYRYILTHTAGTNTASLDLQARMGFRTLARIPGGWESGVDTVINIMARGDCRWIAG